jgi:hypothetical protein
MKRLSIAVLLAAASGLFALSCGSSSGGGASSSGIPRSDTVGSLNASQAATLCDWENAKQGGYGRTVTCSDGSTQTTDPDQATCAAVVPYFANKCPTLTVGDIEDCADGLGTNICNLPTESACAALNACING